MKKITLALLVSQILLINAFPGITRKNTNPAMVKPTIAYNTQAILGNLDMYKKHQAHETIPFSLNEWSVLSFGANQIFEKPNVTVTDLERKISDYLKAAPLTQEEFAHLLHAALYMQSDSTLLSALAYSYAKLYQAKIPSKVKPDSRISDLLNFFSGIQDKTIKTIPQLNAERKKLVPLKFNDVVALTFTVTKLINREQRKMLLLKENYTPKTGTLDLSRFRLQNLDELNSMYHVTAEVKELDLSHNELSFIPDFSFKKFPNLSTLNLKFNKITQLGDRAFDYLKGLDRLDISHNALTNISPSTLDGLANLEFLYLDHNRLTSLTMNGLPKLRQLDASYNRIKKLNEGFLKDSPTIRRLNFIGNPGKDLNLSNINPHCFTSIAAGIKTSDQEKNLSSK